MKEKPQYNVLENLLYLGRICAKVCKGLLVCLLVQGLCQLAVSLVQLFLAPVVLQKVEVSAPLGEMLATTGLFTLALMLGSVACLWLEEVLPIYSGRLFNHFFVGSIVKSVTTSYSNTLDTHFLQMNEKAFSDLAGNSDQTPPVALIRESGRILTAALGFGLYLVMLTGLQPMLVLITVLTSVASFVISYRVGRWDHAHRDQLQKLSNEAMYPVNIVRNNSMPKDIRIFHMQSWLLEVHDKAQRLMMGLYEKREAHQMLANTADVLLTLARNAVSYGYLLHLVLREGLPASQFLLYFSAITGWITTILESVLQICRQSHALCHVRRQLEWPEPFRFEGGEAIPKPMDNRYELRLENISLRYAGSDRDIFHDLNLTIRPGEKLAIVGLNGAGKTTLVKLLCGLLDHLHFA